MSKYLEYILSLKDKMSDPLKKVTGVSTATMDNIGKLKNQVNELDRSFSKAGGGGVSRFNIAMGSLIATGITRLGSIVTQVAQSAIDGTIKREQDIIGLTTFLGANAKEVYRNIQMDAAKTPFDTQSLLDMNKALISAGVNAGDARNDTLNLANAVSAVGKGNAELSSMAVNMQQIKILGKASAMDIRQFGFAGINIYKLLSNATGKSIADVQKMNVTYELLSAAFEKAAGKGGMYEGALLKQSGTLGALIETAKDTFNIFLADLGDQSHPMLKKLVGYFQTFVSKVPQIFAYLSPVITVFGKLFFWVIDIIRGVINIFQWWYKKIQDGNPWIIGITVLIGAMVAGFILLQAWALISTTVLGVLALAANGVAAAFEFMNVANPILWIVALIGLVGYLIYRFSGWGEAWDNLVKFLSNSWKGFKETFNLIWLYVQDGFLSGIELMQKAWYHFKSLWDEDGANEGLKRLNDQAANRAKEIAESKGKIATYTIDAAMAFNKIGLKDTGRGVGDFINDVKDKLGLTPDPNAVNTRYKPYDGTGKNKKSSETVATGGTKNTTINIQIGKQIEKLTVVSNNIKEGAEKIRDIIVDEMSRAIAMGQAVAD